MDQPTVLAEDIIKAGVLRFIMEASSYILRLSYLKDQGRHEELLPQAEEHLTSMLKKFPISVEVHGQKTVFEAGRIYLDDKECVLQIKTSEGEWYTVR